MVIIKYTVPGISHYPAEDTIRKTDLDPTQVIVQCRALDSIGLVYYRILELL